MKELIVKTNKLNSVIQNLELSEVRIMQLAIVDARNKGLGISSDEPLTIQANRYAEVFNTTIENAYQVMKQASDQLFKREFSFLQDKKKIKSRWISQTAVYEDGKIEIIFAPAVVKEIMRLDGKEKEQAFTKYFIENTNNFNSRYSIRMYELLIQWKTAKKIPIFIIETLREQLGLKENQYKKMSNFKDRVLNTAIDEINEKSDIEVSYEQVKEKAKIIGFKFKIKQKKTKEKTVKQEKERDKNVIDWISNKTDKEQEIIKANADAYIAKMNITNEQHKQNIYKKADKEEWGLEQYRAEKKANQQAMAKYQAEQKAEKAKQDKFKAEKEKAKKETEKFTNSFLFLSEVEQNEIIEKLKSKLYWKTKELFEKEYKTDKTAFKDDKYSYTFKTVMREFLETKLGE